MIAVDVALEHLNYIFSKSRKCQGFFLFSH